MWDSPWVWCNTLHDPKITNKHPYGMPVWSLVVREPANLWQWEFLQNCNVDLSLNSLYACLPLTESIPAILTSHMFFFLLRGRTWVSGRSCGNAEGRSDCSPAQDQFLKKWDFLGQKWFVELLKSNLTLLIFRNQFNQKKLCFTFILALRRSSNNWYIKVSRKKGLDLCLFQEWELYYCYSW